MTDARGFTLIEILIVISIIGLLSSAVFSSAARSRANAKAAAIKSELTQFAKLLELNYIDTGSYRALQPNAWNNCSLFIGAYAVDAKLICDSLMAKRYGSANDIYFGVNTSAGLDYTNTYSVMVHLPDSNNYVCAGGSGAWSEGPINPGSGSWTGKGCYANP